MLSGEEHGLAESDLSLNLSFMTLAEALNLTGLTFLILLFFPVVGYTVTLLKQ